MGTAEQLFQVLDSSFFFLRVYQICSINNNRNEKENAPMFPVFLATMQKLSLKKIPGLGMKGERVR